MSRTRYSERRANGRPPEVLAAGGLHGARVRCGIAARPVRRRKALPQQGHHPVCAVVHVAGARALLPRPRTAGSATHSRGELGSSQLTALLQHSRTASERASTLRMYPELDTHCWFFVAQSGHSGCLSWHGRALVALRCSAPTAQSKTLRSSRVARAMLCAVPRYHPQVNAA